MDVENSRIEYPNHLSIGNLCQFTSELAKIPVQNRLTIDTRPAGFFTPTSLIMLAKAGGTRNRLFEEELITYVGLDKHEYANNFGLADALGIVGRPFPQRAFGNQNYIPMSVMRRGQLDSIAQQNGFALGDAIQSVCNEIAPVVARKKDGQLCENLANAFREVFRNTFEHSECDKAFYCAQYWPSSDEVEICVADRGIGIKNSLLQDDHNKPADDLQALELAIMPGISSKARAYKNKRSIQKSDWDNSGYGLFFLYNLFGSLGHFFAGSGKRALLFELGSGAKFMDCELEGTVISLRLSLKDEEAVNHALQHIRDKAFKVKEKFGTRNVNLESVRAFLANPIESIC